MEQSELLNSQMSCRQTLWERKQVLAKSRKVNVHFWFRSKTNVVVLKFRNSVFFTCEEFINFIFLKSCHNCCSGGGNCSNSV